MNVLCYLLVGLVSLVSARRYAHNLPSRYRGYARGPNVCAVQEVSETKRKLFTSCVGHKFLKYICERPSFVSYDCCPGFRQIPGERGCTGVNPVEDIVQTLKTLEQTHFPKLARQAGLEEKLRTGGAYTVFVPSNQAFQEAQDNKGNLEPNIPGEKSPLLYHIVPGRVNVTKLRRGTYYRRTLYGDKSVMVNKFGHGAMTVNCARIERPDVLATNGVIHLIDGVLEPSEVDKTLSDKVFADDQYSSFQLALFVAEMANELRREDVKYTVFAPTNEAFNKLPDDLQNRILTDADTAQKVIRNHLVEGVYCKDAVVLSMGLKTQADERVMMKCKRDGTYFSHGKIVDGDNVVSNGVLHGVDKVALPPSVREIPDVAKDMRLRTFVDLAEKNKLTDKLRSYDEDITVMIPTDEAFEKLPPRYLSTLKTQPLTMEKLIDYHTVKGKFTRDKMVGNQDLETKLDISAKIKINVFREGVAVNAANMVGREAVCGNGVIHKVDSVLLPPEGTLMDQIILDPNLSTLRQAVETAGLTQMLSAGGQKTLIAPTNRAFEYMNNKRLNQLMTNPTRLKKFLERHIVNRLVVECAIPEGAQYRIRSQQGDQVTFTKDTRKKIMINRRFRVKTPDQLATNGVMYKIDDILKCSCEPSIR